MIIDVGQSRAMRRMYECKYLEVDVDLYVDRGEEGYEHKYYKRMSKRTRTTTGWGAAPAMQYVCDPEIRMHMLIVYRMLCLMGFDHTCFKNMV